MNSNSQDLPQTSPDPLSLQLQPIQKVEDTKLPGFWKRLGISAKSAAAVHVIAFGIGAAGGTLTGLGTQKIGRLVTGFDAQTNAAAIKKWEPKKIPYQEHIDEEERKRTQSLWENIKEKLSKSKEAILDPVEFIENIEMYRTAMREYYLGKQRFDAATFWVPGLIMLIMLWKFSSTVIGAAMGDPVRKHIDKMFADKLDEIAANQNILAANQQRINEVIRDMEVIIDQVRNGAQLTPEQVAQINEGAQQIEAALLSPEEVDVLLTDPNVGTPQSETDIPLEPEVSSTPQSTPTPQTVPVSTSHATPEPTPSPEPEKLWLTDPSKW